jgi:hypothetical protein
VRLCNSSIDSANPEIDSSFKFAIASSAADVRSEREFKSVYGVIKLKLTAPLPSTFKAIFPEESVI